MIVQPKSELVEGTLLLLVAFLLVNAPNCHLSFVLASVVQGGVVNCNTTSQEATSQDKAYCKSAHVFCLYI